MGLSQPAKMAIQYALNDGGSVLQEVLTALELTDEAGYLEGVTPGTAEASTALVLDADGTLDTLELDGTTTGLEVSGAADDGVLISGACTDAIEVSGACTDVVEVSVAVTNVINVSHVSTTGTTVIHLADAFLGMVIETGSYASAASSGITLSATNKRPVSFLFDDGGVALGDANYRAVLSRIYVAETQTGQIALRAMRGQVKVASTKDLTIGTNEMNAINGVEGYIEMAGTHTIGANARVAAVHGLVEVNDDITLTAGGKLVGLYAELSQVTAKTVSGVGTAGILVDRLDPDHATNQAAWGTGLVIAASACTTGISIGVCTTGLIITGATGYAIDIATSGQFRMGIQGTGIPTLTATPFAMEIHAETGAVALTAGATGLTCGIRCRYEVSVDQTNQISFEAIDARLRVKKDLADGNHCGVNGTIEASETGTVLSGTGTTVRSGGFFSLDFSADVSITSGWLCGATIDSSVHGDVSMASCTFCGLRIKTSTSKEPWEYGIYLDADCCTDGIYLGATTKAHEMLVSALPANARGARYAFTCATPAMSDGYGAHEIDLTVTGTATAAIAASSTWVNLGASATAPSYTFVRNDGIWDGGATLTTAYISWGKYHCMLQSNPAWCSIWELNFDGANSEIDAIFNCNNPALALGYLEGTPTKAAVGSIPFCSTAGGTIRYIYLYDAADAD